jgi:hypothetical protein
LELSMESWTVDLVGRFCLDFCILGSCSLGFCHSKHKPPGLYVRVSHPGFHVRSSTSGVSRSGCLCLDAILAQLGEFGRACTRCTPRQGGWLYRHDSFGALVRHQGLTHCQGLDSIRQIPFGMFVVRDMSSGIDVVRECQAHTRFNASTSKFQSMCNQRGTYTRIRKTVTFVSTVDHVGADLGKSRATSCQLPVAPRCPVLIAHRHAGPPRQEG